MATAVRAGGAEPAETRGQEIKLGLGIACGLDLDGTIIDMKLNLDRGT